jgi:hypothetical protein
VAITFSSYKGGVLAYFGDSTGNGDTDLLKKDFAPGHVDNDIIRFARGTVEGTTTPSGLAPTKVGTEYIVINGIAEYRVISVGTQNYTVTRQGT